MECYGADMEKENRKRAILEKNGYSCSKSKWIGQPVFLRKSWRMKRKKRKENDVNIAIEKNCMCTHKTFVPTSKKAHA